VEHLKQRGLYSSLEAAMAAARYQVEWESKTPLGLSGAYYADNPAQQFGAYFTPEVLRIADAGSSEWQMGMRLSGYGYGDSLIEVKPGEMRAAENQIEIDHHSSDGPRSTITEWYINKADGLEQGFTIAERPRVVPHGEWLRVRLLLEGDMRGEMIEDGEAILMRQAEGGALLRYDKLVAWDATGRALAARMRLNGCELSLEVEDVGAVYPLTIDPIFTQQAKLTASDGNDANQFGFSVGISGETAVVGANNGQGSAYVFVRSGAAWNEQAKLTASDGAGGDQFGGSVAISGETVVVGARQDDLGANIDQGSAYVFVRSGTTWSQQTKLTASDGAANDFFGGSVAISGETTVVGALSDNVGANTNQGSAYVFVRSGVSWNEQAKLTASDGATSDQFGNSVAISGETVIVGASGDDVGANPNQGSAYVFMRSGGSWSQQTRLMAVLGRQRTG
jgi:hypothetical protein